MFFLNKNRRHHLLVDKPLQLRYMLYVSLPLIVVCAISFFSLYLGIWADVLTTFTSSQVQEDLITATRMTQYEEVRQNTPPHGVLSVFKSAEKLSERQREIFKEILDQTNRNIAFKIIILLFFIAWGTIYISHKIAGPIYHMSRIAKEIQKGNYKARIFLRKRDEAHPLAEQMNETFDSLDQRLARIKKWLREKPPQEAVSLIEKELEAVQTHTPH